MDNNKWYVYTKLFPFFTWPLSFFSSFFFVPIFTWPLSFFSSFFFDFLFLDYKTLLFVSLNFHILTILSLLIVENESSNSVLFIHFQTWHFTFKVPHVPLLFYIITVTSLSYIITVTSLVVIMVTTTIFYFNPCYLTSTRTWLQSPSHSPFFFQNFYPKTYSNSQSWVFLFFLFLILWLPYYYNYIIVVIISLPL